MASKDMIKEKALAAWRFQPRVAEKEKESSMDWIMQASQRDMDFAVRALEMALCSAPPKDNIFTTVKANEENCRRIPSNAERILVQKTSAGKALSRKRPRSGRGYKSSVTFAAADRNEFRTVVQHNTGQSVLKPQPIRPFTAPSIASQTLAMPLQIPQPLEPPSFSLVDNFNADCENFSHNILFQTPDSCDPVAGKDIFLELNDVSDSSWLNFAQYR